jgi:hypothetical protein
MQFGVALCFKASSTYDIPSDSLEVQHKKGKAIDLIKHYRVQTIILYTNRNNDTDAKQSSYTYSKLYYYPCLEDSTIPKFPPSII